jgi:ATP-dependent Lhr-like helicase
VSHNRARLFSFRASGGSDIHPYVRKKMREVLFSDQIPIYLDDRGKTMLATARKAARNAGLKENRSSFFADGRDLYWFTWTGTCIQRTLMAFARNEAGFDVHDADIALVFENVSEADVRQAMEFFLRKPPAADALAALIPNKVLEKYDLFLSNGLLAKVFGCNSLDVHGACSLLSEQFREIM